MKETLIGYVDLNERERDSIQIIEFINKKGLLFRQSSLSKRFIKQFINKTNKNKLYKIVLKEIKR